MKRGLVIRTLILAACIFAARPGAAVPASGGVSAGDRVLATVNDEPIRLAEYVASMESMHEGMGESDAAAERNYLDLLRRLVNTRLILQESGNIGLNELPEVRSAVDGYSAEAMRKLLLKRQIVGVKPDEASVRKLYASSIREYKIQSVLFPKKEDAEQAASSIARGESFDNVIRRAISEGKAKGEAEGGYVRENRLQPGVAKVVTKMKKGAVSRVVTVSGGHTILKLEDARSTEDPAAEAQARRDALRQKRVSIMSKYVERLKKKYVKIHGKTLKALDFEADAPGFKQLLKDRRVIAEVRGEKPITAAEMSKAVAEKFYHGIEQAIREKKVNRVKMEVLNEMLYKRVLRKEALKEKIDRTEEYKRAVRQFSDAVVFGTFVKKVVVPEIQVEDGALEAYYRDHREEFTTPEMVRIDSLVYVREEDAEDAIRKLRNGADFKWMKTNSSGQVEEGAPGADRLRSGGAAVIVKGLPGDVQKAISGAGTGDYRLYASSGGPYYVVYVQESFPPKVQPYESVIDSIRKRIFQERQKKAVDDWTEKLRAASDVTIHVTEDELKALVATQLK